MGDVRDVFHYDSFNTAYKYLDRGAILILLQEGLYYLSEGEKNIDTGSISKMFENVSKNKILIGKPSSYFVETIMEELNINDPKEYLIVGDDATLILGWEMN